MKELNEYLLFQLDIAYSNKELSRENKIMTDEEFKKLILEKAKLVLEDMIMNNMGEIKISDIGNTACYMAKSIGEYCVRAES